MTKSVGPQQELAPTSGQGQPIRKQGSSDRLCIEIDAAALMKTVVMKINERMSDREIRNFAEPRRSLVLSDVKNIAFVLIFKVVNNIDHTHRIITHKEIEIA